MFSQCTTNQSSPLSLTGCGPTACNSTSTRQSSCGAQWTVANICPLLVLPSALLVRPQPPWFVILASTSTRTCQCVVTSDEPCRIVFATLRQLRTIRHQVPTTVFQSLATALVLPHLDYCNSVLYGLSTSLIRHLQSVQNATARFTFSIWRSEHISPALISLHWLRIPERISFKLAVLTNRAIHGAGPSH